MTVAVDIARAWALAVEGQVGSEHDLASQGGDRRYPGVDERDVDALAGDALRPQSVGADLAGHLRQRRGRAASAGPGRCEVDGCVPADGGNARVRGKPGHIGRVQPHHVGADQPDLAYDVAVAAQITVQRGQLTWHGPDQILPDGSPVRRGCHCDARAKAGQCSQSAGYRHGGPARPGLAPEGAGGATTNGTDDVVARLLGSRLSREGPGSEHGNILGRAQGASCPSEDRLASQGPVGPCGATSTGPQGATAHGTRTTVARIVLGSAGPGTGSLVPAKQGPCALLQGVCCRRRWERSREPVSGGARGGAWR